MASTSIMVHAINLSLSTPDTFPIVHAMQYDNAYRMVMCRIFIDSVQYEVPDSTIVSVSGMKSNGTYFQYDSETASDVVSISSGLIAITITSSMTDVAGRIPIDVRLVSDDGDVLGVFPFVLDVRRASYENSALVANSTSSLYDKLLEDESILEQLFGGSGNITSASIDDDGYLNVSTNDGTSITFTWDAEGNVTITY